MIRVRRAVTRPYSAATKKAFSRMRTATPASSRKSFTPATSGRRYWAVSRPPALRASIGNGPAVETSRGAAGAHEALQVGERLRNREAARDRRERRSEEVVRDVETGARLAAERRAGAIEPLVVVRDDHGCASGGILDGNA